MQTSTIYQDVIAQARKVYVQAVKARSLLNKIKDARYKVKKSKIFGLINKVHALLIRLESGLQLRKDDLQLIFVNRL